MIYLSMVPLIQTATLEKVRPQKVYNYENSLYQRFAFKELSILFWPLKMEKTHLKIINLHLDTKTLQQTRLL